MLSIKGDKSIHLTRGDVAVIEISATENDGETHMFQAGDILRLRIFEKNQCDNIVLQKNVDVENESSFVDISLSRSDTKIGTLISQPKDYWYEIELNPDTCPQTIIGYDSAGPKIFRLYPEGDDKQ